MFLVITNGNMELVDTVLAVPCSSALLGVVVLKAFEGGIG
jgi:hypothetical protein